MTPEEWDMSMVNYQAYQRSKSHPISNPASNGQRYEPMRRSGTENPPVIKTEDGTYFTYTPERRDWSHTAPGYSTNNGIAIGTQPAQQPVASFLQAPNPRRGKQADMLTSPPWTSASAQTATPAYDSYLTPNPIHKYTNTNGGAGPHAIPAGQYFASTAPHASALDNSGSNRLIPGHNPTVQQPTPQYHSHYESRRHGRNVSTASNIAVFNPNFKLQQSFYPNTTMSMSYDDPNQAFSSYPQSAMMHDPNQEQDDNLHHPHRQVYPDPGAAMDEMAPYSTQALDATSGLTIDGIPELRKDEDDPASPDIRSPAIVKPNREVTKGDDGRFVCTWPGCTEDTRTFNRKCEWSKHMDKHDRPYKCPAEGCEKLPGFTYSGGLLRHQREVHHLHGGPRKQLNCPHPNCKRFSGKGFSRQENLNEHLRRVHTDAGDMQNGEETEEEGNERAGEKRKRSIRDEQPDMRQEMARLRQENEDLRRTSDNMIRQLQTLQTLVGAGMQQQQQQNRAHQAPQAPMM